ncbi:MAG: hypothetical protein QOH81_438 [Sphingomonadales bacterium]|jgi:hypothetical protein|nr:hypothetical protein [Sphingomonadales bacterium]
MEFSLTWLPDVLRSAGLKVAEHPGWRTRGRGEMGSIRGVMCHHTGVKGSGVMPTLNALVNGRAASPGVPALEGPLAQLGLGRDGTFFIIAAGRANHAGPGVWKDVTTGNSSFIGIEAENSGKPDDPWPPVQMDAYVRGAAAILEKIDADANWCCGHKEYRLPLGYKDDPSFDMHGFRIRVDGFLKGMAPPPQLIPAADAKSRPTLRRGASGDLVKEVQAKLGLDADGAFGPFTEAAVRQFQRAHDLVPDGIFGPKSWAAFDQA